MSHIQNVFGKIAAFFGEIRSASAVAAAIENGRRPASADLRRLGIDPLSFDSIGHG